MKTWNVFHDPINTDVAALTVAQKREQKSRIFSDLLAGRFRG